MMIPSEVPALIRRLVSSNLKFGGYRLRPEQKDLLIRMVDHMVMRWDHSPHAPLMVQEAGTGMGKTLVVVLLACLFALEGLRTVIAVHTIALREQIISVMETVMLLLEAMHREFGLPLRQIRIDRLASMSQYISPTKVQGYQDYVTSHDLSPNDRMAWDEFYEFVTVWNSQQNGSEPCAQFHDWYEQSGGKPLPIELGSLNLCLDEKSDPELAEVIKQAQHNAFDADILVVTQTMLRMLSWKMRSYDTMEKDGREIRYDCGAYEFLIVDEGHSLPKITRNSIEQTVDFGKIREILEDSPFPIKRVMDKFARLETHLQDRLTRVGPLPFDTPDLLHPLQERIIDFYEAANDVYQDCESEPVFQAHLQNILLTVLPAVSLRRRSGTGDAAHRELADTDSYPIGYRRRGKAFMKFKPGALGRTVSSTWRRNKDALNRRLFKSVIILSGTLCDAKRDPQNPYQHFLRDIGAFESKGPKREVLWYGDPIRSANVGHVTRVVYTERAERLRPILSRENDFRANPAHNEYIAHLLHHIHQSNTRGDNRILALFMSEQALIEVHERLMHLFPEMEAHVIAQRSGMRFVGKPLQEFRADRRSILLSMNWQGINAVDERERSLVDHLVITKIPMAPADERQSYDSQFLALRAVFNDAHWMFRQGIGRAGRDPTARYTLWLCDPRFPLPSALVPPYPKYPKDEGLFASQIRGYYDRFDEVISSELFGMTKSQTGLLNGTVSIGYARFDGKTITVRDHESLLVP